MLLGETALIPCTVHKFIFQEPRGSVSTKIGKRKNSKIQRMKIVCAILSTFGRSSYLYRSGLSWFSWNTILFFFFFFLGVLFRVRKRQDVVRVEARKGVTKRKTDTNSGLVRSFVGVSRYLFTVPFRRPIVSFVRTCQSPSSMAHRPTLQTSI